MNLSCVPPPRLCPSKRIGILTSTQDLTDSSPIFSCSASPVYPVPAFFADVRNALLLAGRREARRSTRPKPVGELDIERPDQLVDWLRSVGRIGFQETPSIRILAGGVSNRTVWVARSNGETWVLKQALERLRVAAHWVCSPERIHREALGMRWLATLAPTDAVPKLVFEDRQHHLLGMQAVPEPHSNWKTVLLQGCVDPDHVRQFGRLLGTIHRRSLLAAAQLKEVFSTTAFFESLRLQPFYEYPKEDYPETGPFLNALVEETRATRLALVHGDYSPKNILVYRGCLRLLDHEVIHWGDPMFDVGFAVAHLLSKAHHNPCRREALVGAVVLFWEHYQFAACPCLTHADRQACATRHALACLLARVIGKSPVDYLDEQARLRQRDACFALLISPPSDLHTLVDRFLREIGAREPR